MKKILLLTLLLCTNSYAAGPVIWGPGGQAKNLQSGGLVTQGTLALKNTSGSQPILQLFEDPDNGTNKVSLQSTATLGADYTLTLPVDDGTASQALTTDGSGLLSWSSVALGESVSTQTNTNYTITDGDGFSTVLFSTGNTNRTATLPDVATNINRRIRIVKIDTGTGSVAITRAGSATITGAGVSGATSISLLIIGDSLALQSDGTNWYIVIDALIPVAEAYYITGSTANTALANATFEILDFDTSDTNSHSAVATGASWAFTAPRAGKYMVTANFAITGNSNWNIGEAGFIRIRKNSNQFKDTVFYPPGDGSASVAPSCIASILLTLASGDTIDVQGRQDSGTGLNITTTSKEGYISIQEIR